MSTAVDASMPEQLAQYEEELKLWAESRTESSSSQSDKDKVCHIPRIKRTLSLSP